MREIKFRAWLPSLEKMTYPHTLDVLISTYNNNWSNGTNRWMQYTGLKDKCGNEIYEGDIVCVPRHEKDHFCVVKYMAEKEYPAFDLDPPVGYDCNELSYLMAETGASVIGNIYENPELLESR